MDAAPVSISPLELTIRALPLVGGKPIVNLELDEDGNITDEDGKAVDPKVEVKIENVSAKAVKVFIQGVDPRARDKSAAQGRIHVVGEFPLELGVLQPGADFTRESDLEFKQDGRFDFFVQATGSVEGWSGGITVSGRGAALGWKSMTPNEKDEFILAILPHVQRRAYLILETPFTPEKYEEAYDYVENATYTLFGGVEEAYASDDPARIAEMWGRVFGHIGTEVVTAALPAPKFNQLIQICSGGYFMKFLT